MKASTIFSIFVLLLFLFSACNSIAPTPTATATLPAAPTVAPAVTEAPTAVPTATEAIDPQTGWKMQMVDGEKQLFSPDVNAWVVPNGSAYLIRHDEWSPISDAFQMQVFYLAENGFVAPAVSQAPVSPSARFNFTTDFLPKVEMRMLGHMLTDPKDDVSMLQSGKKVSFTTPAGPQSFTITTDSKYRVYLMPKDKMPAGYQEWKSQGYRWIAKGDGTNAIAIVSIDSLTSKDKFMGVVMYPLAAMMTPHQSVGLYTPTIQAYAAGSGDYQNADSLSSFDVSGLP